MNRTRHYSLEVEVNGLTFRVEACFTAGIAGRFSGPPEDCFPDEPDELEVESVSLVLEEGVAAVPVELLEAVYVGKLGGLGVMAAGQTLMQAIAMEAMENVYFEIDAAARERDAEAHGDWLADRSFRG